jgi:hypothetical protein
MLARQMREIEDQIVANGRVEDHELRMLEKLLYSDGKIDRKEANFLVEVHKRVAIRSPALEVLLQIAQRPRAGQRIYRAGRGEMAAPGPTRRRSH